MKSSLGINGTILFNRNCPMYVLIMLDSFNDMISMIHFTFRNNGGNSLGDTSANVDADLPNLHDIGFQSSYKHI
jgi:hypothetical protein